MLMKTLMIKLKLSYFYKMPWYSKCQTVQKEKTQGLFYDTTVREKKKKNKQPMKSTGIHIPG